MSGSETTTCGIHVSVEPRYSPEHSNPQQQEWFFLYTITIANESDETVQLLNRHWVITDAMGEIEEVRGPGVVGHQPILKRGESFQYTSGCPLKTPFGSMRGTYEMLNTRDERFLVEIAPFILREPNAYH